MRKKALTTFRIARGANPGLLVLGVLCIGLLAMAPAGNAADLPGLSVIGVAADGTETPLTDYRWLVEEDLMYHVPTVGGVPQPDPDTLAVNFHRSYMPVHAKGCVNMPAGSACKELDFVDTGSHYYVSVVPRSGYSIGGAAYDPVAGATVYVNEWNIPTAQISILIFEDNFPINNAPDLPGEDPANPDATDMSGFQIIVEDAGGRYGASAGVQSQDAFGNPLGTTYADVNGDGIVDRDADDDPIVSGYAPLITDSTGRLSIKNLAPGKYGIQAIPPAGPGWQQTSTIEGTKIIDAWVEANEPPFFAEFGPVGFHVFIGFVREFSDPVLSGGATITGTVVNNHMSRPPDYAFFNGGCFGHTTPWVGLNDMSVGIGKGIYAAPTDDQCNFSIPNVPDGNYQLVFWDNNLDLIFAFKGISILGGECSGPTGCNLLEVPIFQWFHRQEHFVYNDLNADGFYDPADGETPILEQAVIIRWRDGTIYQENVSDPEGLYAFDQVFPFFSWLVTEVDFARFEATSLTVVADNGGAIPFGANISGIGPEGDLTAGSMINPQDQTNPPDLDCVAGDPDPLSGDNCGETTDYRIDLGPVLTAGFQGFIGQTHAFNWGKRHYADGENGGVSGIVFYAITRAENDPEYAAAEPWEPGIPGVTVNLYASDGVNPDGVAVKGALLNTTTTDSWDDSIPTGCKWGNGATGPFSFDPDGVGPIPATDTDCYDGLRNFNQIRPAVFDGGYAFDAVCADTGGMLPDGTCAAFTSPMPVGDYIVEVLAPPGYEILKPEDKNVDFGDAYEPVPELLPAACVGELALIPPYLTLFPDEQVESPFAWDTGSYVPTSRPLCDSKFVTLSAGANAAADFWLFTEVPIAGHGFGFILDDTQNEFDPNSPQFGEKYAPPFVPVTIRDWTGRVIGKTLSDQYGRYNFLAPSTITTNLPAPSGMSPNMLTTCMNDPGEDPDNPDPNHNQQYSTFCYTFQYMPGTTTYLDTPVVPVAAVTGSDQFPLDCEYPDGTPRIWDVDGDGFGPYLATDSGTLTISSMVPGQGCDPVLGCQVQNPNYCNAAAGECPDSSDTTNQFVNRDFGFGATPGSVFVGEGDAQMELVVSSWADGSISATVPVGTTTGQLKVVRGDNGAESVTGVTVQIGLRAGANLIRVMADEVNTLATPIQDAIGTDLVAGAGSNDLILVDCGRYNEMVVMWKPVQLQGSGECTSINAVNAPANKLQDWRDLVAGLTGSGKVDLLPGQEAGGAAPEPVTLQTEEGAGVLVLARAGGDQAFDYQGGGGPNLKDNIGARIDGFTVKSASTGGGIIVNGYGDFLQISNNRVANNQGAKGGGIRVGHPDLVAESNLIQGGCPDGATICYADGDNDWVDIHHNQVVFNGSLGGAGAGISMCTGSDSYRITGNWVCGNFSLREGGGIGHVGVSDGEWVRIPDTGASKDQVWTLTNAPLIKDNTVIFNESFYQAQTVSGGGIYAGGTQPLTPGGLTAGAGNLQIIGNLIQGNSAGAGDGGGIRLAAINGQDVANNPDNTPQRNGNQGRDDPRLWNTMDVFNNMIVNNVAALAGGGISMQDAVDVRLLQNTIANNDSLATAGEAFPANSANRSEPQPGAGIVSRTHSTGLAAAGNVGTFSAPTAFDNNIVRQNRQFFFIVADGTPGDPGSPGTWGLCPDIGDTLGLGCPSNEPVYDDLAVIGAGCLSPEYSVLTTLGPDASGCSYGEPLEGNLAADPLFVAEYFNGNRSSVSQPETTTPIQAPPAFDEGGNFIRAKYGPLTLYNDNVVCDLPADPTCESAEPGDGFPGVLFGDYHLFPSSPARDMGYAIWTDGSWLNTTVWDDALWFDIDGEPRPDNTDADIGADEVPVGAKIVAPDDRPTFDRRPKNPVRTTTN